jgi:hypothetical protein
MCCRVGGGHLRGTVGEAAGAEDSGFRVKEAPGGPFQGVGQLCRTMPHDAEIPLRPQPPFLFRGHSFQAIQHVEP